jgi:SH3-like domain-containing protein
MISRLNNARTTGVWKYERDSENKIKKQKKFITGVIATVQRGEDLEVTEIEGEWWHVKNSSGVEGWIHNGEVSPILPVEMTSEEGKSSLPAPKTRDEAIERSEDAGGITGGRG